jgi:glycosyltransferase involved in cell wall biosynthesis
LRGVLAQEYHDLEIIAVDDRSIDATGEIMDRLAASDARVRVVHIKEVPARWLGKNNALHFGAAQARGKYVLFIDGDVVMTPTVCARAVSHCESQTLDHLTVIPDMPFHRFWAGALFSEFALNFIVGTQPWRARAGKSVLPVGIGAFNLVRTEAYRAIEGHQRIAMRPDDDMTLAIMLKRAGFCQDVLLGRNMVSVQWYDRLPEMVRGLEKNSFAPFNYSFVLLMLVGTLHFVLNLLPVFVFAGAHGTPRLLAAAALVTMAAARLGIQKPLGRSWLHALVFPVTAALLEFTILRAALITIGGQGITWRDTHYPLAELRTFTIPWSADGSREDPTITNRTD